MSAKSVKNVWTTLRIMWNSAVARSPAYHGQATLSRWRISNARVIRFRGQSDFWKPRWFKPKLQTFQERLGGRVALAAEINVPVASTLCYNLHLESRSNDDLRLAQLNEVLEDSAKYDLARLVIRPVILI
jgi:hypothetical protein